MTVCRDVHPELSRGYVYDMEEVWGRNETLCSEMAVYPCQRDTSLVEQPYMKRFNRLLVQRPAMYDLFPNAHESSTLVNNLTS